MFWFPTSQNACVDRLDELALAARDGNRIALDRFTRATLADVSRMCWYLGDPDTAEELVQESYASMMRSLPKFRGDHTGSARAWLFRIVRNTCADATRRRQRQRAYRSFSGVPDVAGSPDEGWAEVVSLLSVLSDDRRQAFVLTQLLNLPYDETARVLDVPIGTVRSRVARAREQLVEAERQGDSGKSDDRVMSA